MPKGSFCHGLAGNFLRFTERYHFCPSRGKINAKTYRELILDPEVKHAGSKHFNNDSWTFQQDGAHTATLPNNGFENIK